MQASPVLIVTQDAALWKSWQGLAAHGRAVYRGVGLQDIKRWQEQANSLVVVDAQLPDLPAWTDTAWKEHLSNLRSLVLSNQVSDEQGQQVLASGAYGYAHSHLHASSLERVLSCIEAGSIWMGSSLLQRLLKDIDHRLPSNPQSVWSHGLSQREAEVAQLAAVGNSNFDIAEKLQIKERTVRAHLSSVFEKLQVGDRLKLALKVHGIRS